MFTSGQGTKAGEKGRLKARGELPVRLVALVCSSVLTVSILALTPSFASADILHTTPTGTGGCTETDPCNLPVALAWAQAGDEIRLAADEYNVSGEIEINQPNLTISGPPGRLSGPEAFRAFLRFSGNTGGPPKLFVRQANFTLARVSVAYDGDAPMIYASQTSGGAGAPGMRLDRVSVSASPGEAVSGSGVEIINSVIRQTAIGGAAARVSGSITGSTIISAGNAIENSASDHGPPYCELSIENTIAVGAFSNLTTAGAGPPCNPNTYYSDSWIPAAAGFGGGGITPSAFITSGPGNLLDSPPALPDPLSGIVEPTLDSPAIDAGCTAGCGTEDFYGRPRPIGPANDIGAYEVILPPTISTVGVDSKTSNRADLSATINPNGGATTYNFQIRKAGATTWESFDGSTTGEGTLPETVRGTAQPLDPETSYEIRVIGLNSSGVESTSPAVTTFTTDAAPQPVPAAFVQIRSAKAKVTRRAAQIQARIRTSGAGRVTLRATPAAGGTKTWCRVRKTVAAAGVHTVSCNLGRKGRTRIRKSALGLVLKASFTDGTNNSAATQRRFTIPRKR